MKKDEIKLKLLSGGISGIIEACSTHPLDLIKIKLQESAQKNKKINNTIEHFKLKCHVHGRSYMYRGILPKLIGIFPMRLAFWGTQDISNESLKKYNITKKDRLILSGIFAGTIQTLIDNPIEILKIRQMTSKNINPITILRKNYFKGFAPTLVRNTVFATIINSGSNFNSSENHFINFLKSATSGFIASIITQPIDYIKTEQQRFHNKNKCRTISNIIINDYRNLMVGALSRGTLGFFTMGIGFTTYTFISKNIINT